MNSTDNKAAKKQKQLKTLRLWIGNGGRPIIWLDMSQDFMNLHVISFSLLIFNQIYNSHNLLITLHVRCSFLLSDVELTQKNLTNPSSQVCFGFISNVNLLQGPLSWKCVGNLNTNTSKNGNILDAIFGCVFWMCQPIHTVHALHVIATTHYQLEPWGLYTCDGLAF